MINRHPAIRNQVCEEPANAIAPAMPVAYIGERWRAAGGSGKYGGIAHFMEILIIADSSE